MKHAEFPSTSPTVNWRRVLWIAVVFLIVYAGNRDCALDAGAACAVKAQPKMSLAPLRFVRVKVSAEDRAGGELSLLGEAGLETSSMIQAGPVTTWVEWKNVVLGPGRYAVDFKSKSCTARDTFTVAGGDEPYFD